MNERVEVLRLKLEDTRHDLSYRDGVRFSIKSLAPEIARLEAENAILERALEIAFEENEPRESCALDLEDSEIYLSDFECNQTHHHSGSPIDGDYYREDHCACTDGIGGSYPCYRHYYKAKAAAEKAVKTGGVT